MQSQGKIDIRFGSLRSEIERIANEKGLPLAQVVKLAVISHYQLNQGTNVKSA